MNSKKMLKCLEVGERMQDSDVKNRLPNSKVLKLDDDVMELISGGVTTKEFAKITIKTVTSVLGALFGGFSGACGGFFAAANLSDNPPNSLRGKIILGSGVVTDGAIGLAGGITAGYQLGNLICKLF